MLEAWIQRYIKAWSTDDPTDVATLFAEDALYYQAPYATPREGRDAIVSWWIAAGDSTNEWAFEYEIIAEEAHVGVVRAVTEYGAAEGEDSGKTYHNVWIVRFNDDGECVEFTEFWMLAK